jgi:predicted DNA-binding ribbon-helix-helix protein
VPKAASRRIEGRSETLPIDAPEPVESPSIRPNAGVIKRSLVIAGHRTSISIEEAFWRELKALASRRAQSINALVAEIDADRGQANLSSAIRVFLFESAIQ